MYRLLEINFTNSQQLEPIHKFEYSYRKEILKRSIQIVYKLSNKFLIKLYGFDGEIKWQSENINRLSEIFSLIDDMPMGKIRRPEEPNLSNLCGFTNNSSPTSHCFRDRTHQTCCLLGHQARRYADSSGNPIGSAAEKAFYHSFNFKPDDKTLTPWCTCIGSKVCSYYTKKFGDKDGTHIKFINSLVDKVDKVKVDKDEKDENKHLVYKHRTPGILFN